MVKFEDFIGTKKRQRKCSLGEDGFDSLKVQQMLHRPRDTQLDLQLHLLTVHPWYRPCRRNRHQKQGQLMIRVNALCAGEVFGEITEGNR